MAASNAVLTQQIVAMGQTIATLSQSVTNLDDRLRLSEGEVVRLNAAAAAPGGQGGGRGDNGVFDKKRLYPKELRDNSLFLSVSERFVAWVGMDNEWQRDV